MLSRHEGGSFHEGKLLSGISISCYNFTAFRHIFDVCGSDWEVSTPISPFGTLVVSSNLKDGRNVLFVTDE